MIVLTDEAHRSQYDTLALNMRAALPKALFLAFTGTPLIAGEERTKEVFGDYVSIYDFQQSVEDGATVPLFYENRTPELQLVNPDLNEDIYSLIEAAELDPEQEAKLERELSRQYHILTRDDRLETVAAGHRAAFPRARLRRQGDGGVHRQGHGAQDARQGARHWAAARGRTQEGAGQGHAAEEQDDCWTRLNWMQTTDMALVVSPGQNEIGRFKKQGWTSCRTGSGW